MVAIICTARPVDYKTNQPVGPPCGNGFTPRGIPATAAGILQAARAAGWRIGPAAADGTRPASCPACSAPDKEAAETFKALTRMARR